MNTLEPARLLSRFVAAMLDAGIVVAFHFGLAGARWPITAAFYLLYQVFSLHLWGKTLGKAILALDVRTPAGTRIGWMAALLRVTVGYAASTFFLLGFLRALVDARRRCWHDILFGSEVVREEGRLTIRRAADHVARWSGEVDAWQRRLLAPHRRIKSLITLAGKVTLLMEGVLRVVEWITPYAVAAYRSLKRRLGERLRGAGEPGSGSPAPMGTASEVGVAGSAGAGAASLAGGAAAAGAGALAAPAITALILAAATGIGYRVLLAPAAPPYQGVPEPDLGVILNQPSGIALSPDGSIYVAEAGNHRIRRVGPDGSLTTVAGTGGSDFSGDGGPAPEAVLDWPTGVAIGPDGGIYIADSNNDRIRRVDPSGTITTFAGSAGSELGDGGPAVDARLEQPNDLVFGPDGSLYVADTGHHRVRRVLVGGTIVTVAGTGESGYAGDGGPARDARLSSPDGIAVDSRGGVYVLDSGNYRIRRIEPDGTITTIAGGGSGGLGDGGPATEARLDYVPRPGETVMQGLYRGPYPSTGLALAGDGSLYLTPIAFTSGRVRRVGPDGVIVTVAGGGDRTPGLGFPATEAQLDWPAAVAAATDGSVYIAEHSRPGRLLRVLADGTLTAVELQAAPTSPEPTR